MSVTNHHMYFASCRTHVETDQTVTTNKLTVTKKKNITYRSTMDPDADAFSSRPKKRRRTKRGRPLREDNPDAADGIAFTSVIMDTENGPVEQRSAIPVWIDQSGPVGQTSTAMDRQTLPADRGADVFEMSDAFHLADEADLRRPSKVGL